MDRLGGGRRSRAATLFFLVGVALGAPGCTVFHSRQGLAVDVAHAPPSDARFVTEDDSGLLLFGLVSLSEPDHVAVLLERARRKYRCARLRDAQLDFYTEHWLLVGFPVARVTALCEGERAPDAASVPPR